MSRKLIPDDIIEDIKGVGISAFHSWFVENGKSVSMRTNFFDNLEEALKAQSISLEDINNALAELEENSDKKIHLLQAVAFETMNEDKKKILSHLQRNFGIDPSKKVGTRINPRRSPTFNYMGWTDDQVKIKYSELHHDVEMDLENDKIIKIPKKVAVIFIIDLKDGFTQIRYDNPGQYHIHKNDIGKITEGAFENYYMDLLVKLFPDTLFHDMNLNKVANRIAAKEKVKFRMKKEVTTITGNGKQTFVSGSIDFDVRDLPEHNAAVATEASKTWLTEDLTGYWLAEQSAGELKRNLFMRISRKVSEIRVQRGCLEKELNYGLRQIREIQTAV